MGLVDIIAGGIQFAIGLFQFICSIPAYIRYRLNRNKTMKNIKAEASARAILRAMMAVAVADGEVQDSEIDSIAEIYEKIFGATIAKGWIKESAEQMINDDFNVYEAIHSEKSFIDPAIIPLVIKASYFVSAADGFVDDEEITTLMKLAVALGMTDIEAQNCLAETSGLNNQADLKNDEDHSSSKELPLKREEKKASDGPGHHHWGENDKTHNVVRKCSNCNGIFHGEEFKVCEECGTPLVDRNEIYSDLNSVVDTNYNREKEDTPTGEKAVNKTALPEGLRMAAENLGFDIVFENSGFLVIENGQQIRFCFSESELEQFLSNTNPNDIENSIDSVPQNTDLASKSIRDQEVVSGSFYSCMNCDYSVAKEDFAKESLFCSECRDRLQEKTIEENTSEKQKQNIAAEKQKPLEFNLNHAQMTIKVSISLKATLKRQCTLKQPRRMGRLTLNLKLGCFTIKARVSREAMRKQPSGLKKQLIVGKSMLKSILEYFTTKAKVFPKTILKLSSGYKKLLIRIIPKQKEF